MKISGFGYVLEITLQKKDWEQEVVNIVNAEIKKGVVEPRFIELIKRVRKMGKYFPEDCDRDGSTLGLKASKEFVEKHWPQYAHLNIR